MVNVSQTELTKIPFIDSKNVIGRVLTTLTFFEAGEWHTWFPLPTGLVKLSGGKPMESDYFARQPERKTDIYLDFLNFMAQRACWNHVVRPIRGIQCDLHNLGASLGKFSLFHQASQGKKLEVSRFVSTELEYIFGVCRSTFDLFQEIVAGLWQTVELTDKTIKKRQLPLSFRAVVLKDNQVKDVGTIQTQYAIPLALAQFYCRHAQFFAMLRNYRDDVMHGGKDFSLIFVTERGFAVQAETQPFASFGVWNEEHMLPNRLASLRPVIAYVITQTLKACEDFSQTIQKIIQFPSDIAPGFKLFIRGFHNKELIAMKDVLTNCLWWETE